jgi:hypothetical protein
MHDVKVGEDTCLSNAAAAAAAGRAVAASGAVASIVFVT